MAAIPPPIPPFPVQDELSEFEYGEVLRILNERGVNNIQCEVCNRPSWVLSKLVVSPITMGRQDIVTGRASLYFGGNTMPSAPLLCSNCGNTKFLNLVVLGVRGAPLPPPPARRLGENNG